MKKRSKDQLPKSFEHSPFKALKGFTPSARDDQRKPARGERKTSEDDSELFLRAVEGVKQIQPDDTIESVDAKPKTALPERPPVVRRDEQLFLDAMRNIGTVSGRAPEEDDDPDAGQQRPSSSRMKQLKRGTLRISAELDLHGYLRDEAIQQLNRFITAAFTRGLSSILVITGKGINSPDGPVLQGAVAEWLRNAGKGMVAEFAPAPRELGGSGAFVVFLKKR